MKSIGFILVASSLTFASFASAQDAAPAAQPLPPLPATTAPATPASPPPALPAPQAAPAPAPMPAPSAPPPVITHEAPPVASADTPSATSDVPPASTGFQAALRTGYLIPLGSATGMPGEDMSKSFGGEVPLIADLGYKPDPHLFLGGFIGLGVGGSGSNACASCASATFRIGLELQYHFTPEASTNPWIGYGIGIESAAVGNDNTTVSVAGVEYAHFMAGLDFRLSRGVGIGPMIDFSMGSYSHEQIKQNGMTVDQDITNTGTHEWFLIGGRVVFFP